MIKLCLQCTLHYCVPTYVVFLPVFLITSNNWSALSVDVTDTFCSGKLIDTLSTPCPFSLLSTLSTAPEQPSHVISTLKMCVWENMPQINNNIYQYVLTRNRYKQNTY